MSTEQTSPQVVAAWVGQFRWNTLLRNPAGGAGGRVRAVTQLTTSELGGGCRGRVSTEELAESPGRVCTMQGGEHLSPCPGTYPSGRSPGIKSHGPAQGS